MARLEVNDWYWFIDNPKTHVKVVLFLKYNAMVLQKHHIKTQVPPFTQVIICNDNYYAKFAMVLSLNYLDKVEL